MLLTAFVVDSGEKKALHLVIQKGFSDWQHATGKRYGLCLHNTSNEHLRCFKEWEEFKICEKEGKQVDVLLDKAAITLREKNRYYIKTLIELIIVCGRQEIALRGLDENDENY